MLLQRLAERDGDDDARLLVEILSSAGPRDAEADGDALHAVHGRVWPRFEQAVRKHDMAAQGQLLALRVFFKTAPPRLWVVWSRRATCASKLELPLPCDQAFDGLVESLASGNTAAGKGNELVVTFVLFFFLPLVFWAEEATDLSPRLAAIAKQAFALSWPVHRSMRLLTEEFHRLVEEPFAEQLTKSFDEDSRLEVRLVLRGNDSSDHSSSEWCCGRRLTTRTGT